MSMLFGRRTVLLSIVSAAGAACTPDGSGPLTSVATASGGSDAPIYSDPLTGLYNLPATSVPNDVPVDYYTPGASHTGRPASRAVLTMAIVPGANFDRLQAYFDKKKSADLNTTVTVQRVVDVLKERYPWLELMDDLATAQQRNVSLTLIVDIRAMLGGMFGTTVCQLDVIVFDEQRKPLSRLAVEGRSSGGFQEALTDALDKLQTKAKAYLT
jgi:hypothetical protein